MRPRPWKNSLIVGLGLALFLLLILCASSSIYVHNLLEHERAVNQSKQFVFTLERALDRFQEAETGHLGYLLTGDQTFLQAQVQAATQLPSTLAELHRLCAGDPARHRNISRLGTLCREELDEIDRAIALRRDQGVGAAVAEVRTGTSRTRMNAVNAQVQTIEADEQRVLNQKRHQVEITARKAARVILRASALFCVLVVWLAVGAQRHWTRQQKAEQDLQASEACLRHVLAGARCLFWYADIEETGGPHLEWCLRLPDTDAALRYLPIALPPGESFAEAWYHSRLPEDQERTDLYGDGEVRAGRSYRQEFRCRCENGEIRWLHEDVQVQTVVPGRWRAIGVCTDITERKQAQVALAYERNLLRTVIDTIPHNIYVRDITGHYVLNNQSHLHYLGASTPEEVVGKTPFDYFAPDLAASYLENDRKVLQSGNPKMTREEVTRDRRGNVQWHSVTKVPLLDLCGEIGGIVCLTEDITERKLAEQALQQKAEELARSNADLEQFAYVASHDLQEPLRMVSSYVQLLKRRYADRLDADARDFICYAVDGTVRMQTLIKDLLAYSRVATRGKELEPTDCQQILTTTLANLQAAIEESGAVLTCDPLPTVLADGAQLGQLLQNLIGNAIKFHGEPPPRVHVGAVRKGDKWEFSIQDNGIGIEAQYAERVFVIFQRLHAREQYPGTGIGLAICKKIVERHGGHIWMQSEPEKGTTFFFTLPA